MIEEIREQLHNKEFKSTKVNVNGLYLHSLVVGEDLNLLVLMDFNEGGVSSYEQYFSVKNQIYRTYKDKSDQRIKIQTIIFTSHGESVKEIARTDWDAWIVDTSKYNLLVYENQRSDFCGIRSSIESILEGKRPESAYHSYNDSNHGRPYQKRTYQENSYQENPYESPYGRDNNKEYVPKTAIGKYFTKVNSIIILLNVIIFFMTDGLIFGETADRISIMGALYWPSVFYEHEYYRLLTYMFLHGGMEHLMNNMIILLFIGDNLERAVGKWKYFVIYFGSGILAGAASIGYNMLKNISAISVGASGAIFGVVGALAYIVIINKGRLENISTRQIILFVFLSLYGGFTSQGVDNTAHVAGLLAGVIFSILLYRKQKKNDIERGYYDEG